MTTHALAVKGVGPHRNPIRIRTILGSLGGGIIIVATQALLRVGKGLLMILRECLVKSFGMTCSAFHGAFKRLAVVVTILALQPVVLDMGEVSEHDAPARIVKEDPDRRVRTFGLPHVPDHRGKKQRPCDNQDKKCLFTQEIKPHE
jgi:hypothetical protein